MSRGKSKRLRCDWCGRFVGEAGVELRDGVPVGHRGPPLDPDGPYVLMSAHVCADHFAPETTYAEDPLGGSW